MNQLKIRPILLVMLFSVLASFASHSKTIANKELALRNTIERFGVAYKNADVNSLSSMLSDSYIHINGRSGNVINKQAWINWNKTRQRDISTNKEFIEKYEIENLQMEFFENTAFVTGIVISSGIRNGEKFESKIRFSNVWVRSKSQWKRAAFHDSSIE